MIERLVSMIVLASVAGLGGCGSPLGSESQVLGGVEVSPAVLEAGRRVYVRNCAPCHGVDGDGRGASGRASWPPPRDFTSAKFKFAGIADRGLPDDAELVRIISGGLAGTAMPAWDLPETELRDVIDYIKTFSPAGKGFRNPQLVVSRPAIGASPYSTDEAIAGAIDRGRRLYHDVFECAKCHPSLESDRKAIAKWSDNYQSILLPTDFQRHRMRSVRVDVSAGHKASDIFRVTAFGLQGPMPGYIHLGRDKVWDVAHYVKSVADAALGESQNESPNKSPGQ